MANSLYGKARQAFLDGDIDWASDNIKCCLVDTADYTVSIDTHEFLSDLAGIEETSSNLSGKTSTLGVADASDVTFSGTSGDTCEALVIYQDTGVAGTSRLIAYIDSASGLPATLGSDITVRWNASGIFKL